MAEGDRLASKRRLNRESVLTGSDVHPRTQTFDSLYWTEEGAITIDVYLSGALQTLRADRVDVVSSAPC